MNACAEPREQTAQWEQDSAAARLALLAALLTGCAGQQLHRDGLALMAEGRVEEGLAKLTEATEAAPDNRVVSRRSVAQP